MFLRVYNAIEHEVKLVESTHVYKYTAHHRDRCAHHSVTEVCGGGKLKYETLPRSVQEKLDEGTVKHSQLAFYAAQGGFPYNIPYFIGMNLFLSDNVQIDIQAFKSEIPFVAEYTFKGKERDVITVGGSADLYCPITKTIIEYKSFCYREDYFRANVLQLQAYIFYLGCSVGYLVYADQYFKIPICPNDIEIFEARIFAIDFNKYIGSKGVNYVWNEKAFQLGEKLFEQDELLENIRSHNIATTDPEYKDAHREKKRIRSALAKEAKNIAKEVGYNKLIFVTADEKIGVRIKPYRSVNLTTGEIKTKLQTKFFTEKIYDFYE